MIGGLVIGFLLGLAAGAGLVLAVRRPAPTASGAPGPPAPAAIEAGRPPAELPVAAAEPPPAASEPVPAAAAEAGDDEVKRAIDASAGLLDELETRYRDRSAPAGDDEGRPPARRRSPRPPRPPRA